MRKSFLVLGALFTSIFTVQSQEYPPPVPKVSAIVETLDSFVNSYEFSTLLKENKEKLNFKDAKIRDSSIVVEEIKQMCTELSLEFTNHAYRYVLHYSGLKKRFYEITISYGNQYTSYFSEQLAIKNLPDDLKYLPFVWSSYQENWVAKNGATGMWQMMYPYALRYGITVNSYIDHRRNYKKATQPALDYLKDLKQVYETWPLAISAYYNGPAFIQKALARSKGVQSFDALHRYLPVYGRDTYPAWIATIYLERNKKKFNIEEHQFENTVKKGSFPIDKELHFKPLSDVLQIPMAEIIAYNPIYRQKVIPATGTPVLLHLNIEDALKFVQLKDSIYFYQDSVYLRPAELNKEATENVNYSAPPQNAEELYYTVKSGDNLGSIANWYDVKLSRLQAWNNIYSTRINIGQKILVYVPKNKASHYRKIDGMTSIEKQSVSKNKPKQVTTKTTKSKTSTTPQKKGDFQWYKVRSGDSMWLIAKRFPGVSAEDIKKWNNIKGYLKPGQKLKIYKN